MKRITPALWSLLALGLGAINFALAQDLPKTQPKMITIWREEVKPGHAELHAKNEAGFVAAYEKAKSPDYYLAMTSLTGPPEAWYIVPQESYTAMGETMKREDKDPVLSKELGRVGLEDEKYITGLRLIQARAREDLSVGAFPDLTKARFFSITVVRARPGHETEFDAAVKGMGAARLRVAPKFGYRVYQVIAGMPAPTYLIFASVEKYGEFDETTAAYRATLEALNPDEKAAREKFHREGLISTEVNQFKLDASQSYVSKETRATDPAFWSAK